MKKNTRKRVSMESYHKRLMMAFCGISLLLVLISCGLFSTMIVRDAERSYKIYAKNKMEDELRELDDLFAAMRDSFYYLESIPSVNEFLYQPNPDYLSISRTDLVARQFYSSHKYLSSLYMYNQYTDKVIGNGNSAYSMQQFLKKDMPLPANRSTLHFVYAEPDKNADGNQEKTIALVFPGNVSGKAVSASSIVMVLDRQEIEKNILGNVEGIALMTDENGQVLFQNTNSDIMNIWEFIDETEIEHLEEGKTLITRSRYDGKSVYISIGQSSLTGFCVVNVGYMGNIWKNVGKGIFVTLLLTIIIMAIVVIAGYVISKRLYRPIGKVIHLVQGSQYGQKREQGDTVAGLYDSFRDAMIQIDTLESQKEAGKIIEKSNQARRILHGRKASMDLFEQGDILSTISNLFLICFRIDRYQNYNPDDKVAYEKTIGVTAPEILKKLGDSYIVDMAEGELALLFRFKTEQNSFEELLLSLKTLQESLKGNLDLSMTIGIGGVANSLEECAFYYEKAQDMADYRFLYGGGKIFYPHLIDDLIDTGGNYPSELEQKLLKAVRNHNRAEFQAILDNIIEVIRKYSYPKVSAHLIQLISECIKTMNSITHNENQKYDLGLANISHMFHTRESIESIREWMLTLFDEYSEVLGRIHRMKDERYHDIVENAQEYVETNFSNPELNVEAIARQCGYSSYYFSRMFKELTGITPIDYLKKIRIDHAKQLLAEEHVKIAEVASLIGYGNISNFYTNFKKIVGMTPTEYREFIQKQHSQNE